MLVAIKKNDNNIIVKSEKDLTWSLNPELSKIQGDSGKIRPDSDGVVLVDLPNKKVIARGVKEKPCSVIHVNDNTTWKLYAKNLHRIKSVKDVALGSNYGKNLQQNRKTLINVAAISYDKSLILAEELPDELLDAEIKSDLTIDYKETQPIESWDEIIQFINYNNWDCEIATNQEIIDGL